jgi:NAD(P)-dependent dehydrogenase (short-subunit alcohol dehydrogenase family)
LWRTIGNKVLAIVSDKKGNVSTRFVTPFGFHSTAAEVINGVNLASRRAIVTGGASGIGIETARALAGITRRWADQGIVSNAVNPGAIATGLQKYTGGLKTPVERRKTPDHGAATSVLLAGSPLLDGIGGLYFEDCNQSPRVTARPTDFSGGVAPYAVDPDNAERLWDVSLKLIA